MFSQRIKAVAVVGADGTATLTINPPPALMRAMVGGSLQRVVASVPLPPVAQILADSFTTAVASGWGTPEIGPDFQTLVDGTAVGGSINVNLVARIQEGVLAASHTAIASPIGVADVDLYALMNPPLSAYSTTVGMRLIFRVIDVNNYYFLALGTNAAGTVTSIALGKRVAGVETILATSGVLAIVRPQNIRARVIGSSLTGTAWATGTVEPATVTVSAIDLSIVSAGGGGGGIGNTGDTGTLFTWDNMIGTALAAQSPIWDAYLGPVLPPNLADSSVTAASRWVPTLATGSKIYRGEQLNVVARAAPVGQQVQLVATFETE